MPSFTRGPDGKVYTHFSAKESEEQAEAVGTLIIFLVLSAPALGVGYYIFKILSVGLQWHPLFSLIAAILTVVLIGFFVIKSKTFRAIYFGSETIAASVLAYVIVERNADAVWAAFAALVILALGFWGTIVATRSG